MDPELLAQSAGTTVVGLMATDAWQRTREGIVGVWRRIRPAQAAEVDTALEETRDEILTLRQSEDAPGEEDLVRDWQRRLRRLLVADPAVADELQRLLDDARASLPPREQPAQAAHMTAEVSGSGRVYQAGRDQHIVER